MKGVEDLFYRILCAFLLIVVIVLGATSCKNDDLKQEDIMGSDVTSTDSVNEKNESDGVTENVENTECKEITPHDVTFIKWFGRTDKMADGSMSFDYTASGFEVKFRGSKLDVVLQSTNYDNETNRAYVTVIVDGENYREAPYYALDKLRKTISLELDEGEHTVKILKRSEAKWSRVFLKNIETDGVFLKPDARREYLIEFYGDSITCGYGSVSSSTDKFSTVTEDGLAAYAFITSEILGAECSIMAQSGIAVNKNIWEAENNLPMLVGQASYYNENEYSGQRVPDAVVIYGGVNDRSYILAAPTNAEKSRREQAFIKAYTEMIEEILYRNPQTTVFCCTGVYSEADYMGTLIQQAIDAVESDRVVYTVLPAVAAEDGIGADGHPTYKTHEKVAASLAGVISSTMGWNDKRL